MVLISWYDLLYVESYFCVYTLQVNHYIQVFCQILSISILELLICLIWNHSFSWSCSEYYKRFRNRKLQTLLKFFIRRELKFKFMKYLLVCLYLEFVLLQTCMNQRVFVICVENDLLATFYWFLESCPICWLLESFTMCTNFLIRKYNANLHIKSWTKAEMINQLSKWDDWPLKIYQNSDFNPEIALLIFSSFSINFSVQWQNVIGFFTQ